MCVILSGCDAIYNLTINDNFFSENASIITRKNIDEGQYRIAYNLMSYSIETGIPLSISNSTDYYKVRSVDDTVDLGILLDGDFQLGNSNSYLVNNSCENYEAIVYGNKIELKASKFIIFDEYESLDKITVNIKSNYLYSSNNADEVNGDTYTWIIDRNNYNTKDIHITFMKNDIIRESVKKMDTPMKKFFVFIIGLVLIGIIIFFIIKMKRKKTNEF